ncbi:Acyl transferase/acyl hydrolase/lysophospholipase [Penicillium capsulatum]|uniref:Acyl transferase/acyl hydrolase/lysophospholipase n=1 Tax=Penicillium capsulatum TaxID=69766 RepID=A0A9W9LJS8_9EURO|nr:Acyl transferase/acyl hydrolase/lysophospholipase [Penicillium capsulatum]KAJ6116304.1 Acyl transferase/acyl hydrolase/lysophospholipase [Penicillium capsulatum]
MVPIRSEPSLIVFGPQTEPSSRDAIDQLRQEINQNPQLSHVLNAANYGAELWGPLVDFDPTLNHIPGANLLADLQEWVVGDGPLPSYNFNTFRLPVTVLLEISQYFRYLKQLNVVNPHRVLLEGVKTGGVLGFCVGFLSAIAVAASEIEAEVAFTAAAVFRLAVIIGAYVDNNHFGLQGTKVGCIAVRWKEGEIHEQDISNLVSTFPEAYISCNIDAKSITVTARLSDIPSLTGQLRAHGSHVKTVSVEGAFHSDIHTIATEKIKSFAVDRPDLQLPRLEKLQAPLRSTVDGEIITSGCLLQHALENILLKPAAWFQTVQGAVAQLEEGHKTVAFAGFGNHIPASLISGANLHVLDLNKLIVSNINGLSNETSINGTTKSRNGVSDAQDSSPSGCPPNSIAIVGLSGRFPGADSLDELWELLLSGKSMAEPAPVERFQLPTTGEYTNTKWWGNFLRDPDAFDHKFFKKSQREAVAWDPQQRILLEVVYEALESAGYFRAGVKPEPDDYGCYIGAVMNNYYDNMSSQPTTAYATIGTSRCFLSGCVSHFFGWTGPSLTIDTACSSSLVAINTACRAIWSGECSQAVAGGTNVITSPFDYRNLKAAGFLSPSGQCKPFDSAADGYCRGEGVSAVVLKPLADALKEKDHVFGVIVGSAANQNVNLSHITVPHSGSQVKLYRNVMSQAEVHPHSVTYVEAHGTGTSVGDPVECNSIAEALGGPSRNSTLHFGSIKGNIGHTEATAGIAGLVKVLLMMEHGQIPQQASHRQLNPKIASFSNARMEIPRSLLPWDAPSFLACVNSYGAAGSNAAVMVRQGPSSRIALVDNLTHAPIGTRYPVFISAASSTSAIAYSEKLSTWLGRFGSGVRISDVTFNMADRANHSLSHFYSTTVASISELKDKLTTLSATDVQPSPKPIVLVFGGQESESIGVSEQLYQSSTLLRYHLDACNEILISSGFESLYPAIFSKDPIGNLTTLHSALFSIQYASAKAWIDSGLQVDAVVGHSFGQLTALCVSGVLSLADALTVICERASIITRYWGPEPGSMLFLQTDKQTVSKLLSSVPGNVEVACYNGPRSHDVVGSAKEIDTLERFLSENHSFGGGSVRTKRLRVTNGFHSRFTEPLLPHLQALSRGLIWRGPKIHLELCTENAEGPDPRLLASHTRRSVFFQQAIERLEKKFPKSTYLEVGRGSSVIQLAKGCVADSHEHLFLSPQFTTANALTSLADTTVDLWKAGYCVQYWLFDRIQKPSYQFLRLPSYQFEKTRHWLGFIPGRGEKDKVSEPAAEPESVTYELLKFLQFNDKKNTSAVFRIVPQSDRFQSMLKGHVMGGQSLAPASFYFEVVARAALFLQSDISATTWVPAVEDLVMNSPIGLDTNKELLLTLQQTDDPRPSWSFSITTQLPPSQTGRVSAPFETSTGLVYLQRRDDAKAAQLFQRFQSLTGIGRCDEIMNHPDAETMKGNHIYRAFNHIVHYAENFRGIKKVACLRLEAAGKVTIDVEPSDPADQRLCDTPMTDSFMQFAGFLVNYFNNDSLDDVLVCSKISHIELGGNFNPDAKEWIVYSNMTRGGQTDVSADAYIFEAKSGRMVMAAFGFRFSKMSQALLTRMLKSLNKSAAAETSIKPASHQKSDTVLAKELKPPIQVAPSSKPPKVAKKQPSTREDLFQILHNVTDVPLEDMKDDSFLDDLGIDSLMATEVINDIRATLDLTIDLASFLLCSDLNSLVAYVDSKFNSVDDSYEESSGEEWALVGTPTNGSTAPTLGELMDEELVPIEAEGIPTPGECESIPFINSANVSFRDIQFAYDQLAKGTLTPNFWTEAYPHQRRLVLAYVVEAFAKLGCDLARLSPRDVVPVLPVLDRHRKLVRQYHRVLEDGGLISAAEHGFVRTDVPVDSTLAEDIYQMVVDLWPQHKVVTQLVKVIGANLAQCLVGDIDGLQLIFGDRANKLLLEDMYENWPLLRTPTLLLGDFLKTAFSNSNGGGKFRILEIGAGTGGTTKHIVKYLRSHGIPFEYVFTDVSTSLVSAAKKKFKDAKEMSFEVLDIEKAPKQEYENAFHMIIATNCIHATRSLNQSLVTLNRMVRADGAVALFEGWWRFEDDRTHALMNEKHWEKEMKAAGFKEVLWTDGKSPESKTVRVIAAFKSPSVETKEPTGKAAVETVVYKTIGDTKIHADVYYPLGAVPAHKKLPVALMIHGGSHIIFSRKDIRPAQTRLLLEKGFLPVSLDHRLCPEVRLVDGPMVDICDALDWARNKLPYLALPNEGIQIDGERVVVVGWSSGGQLAMSLAWTPLERGLRPPEAILAFYCPTNYEDEWWKNPIQPIGAENQGDQYDLLEAIQDEPITNYGVVGAWEPLSDPRIRTDPRCRIVLHINWKAQTLPIIIGGLPSKKKSTGLNIRDWNALSQPSLDEIVRVSPQAQILRGNYHTPTFLIHGTNDDLIPWQQSQGTYDALRDAGVTAGLALVEGAPHICDLSSNPESDGWKAAIQGYEFISKYI